MCLWALAEAEGGGEGPNGWVLLWDEASWCSTKLRTDAASHARRRCKVSREGIRLEE